MEVVQEVGEGSPHATSLAGTAIVSSRLLSPVSALFIITDSVVDLNLHWTQFIITSITFIRICLRNIIFLLVTNLMVVSHGGW